MDKPSPPPAPDYVGAAEAQGQSNLEATRTGARLNNPDVYSPYGSQTVTYGSGFDQAGYDKALQDYQNSLSTWQSNYDQTASSLADYGIFGDRSALTTLSGQKPVAPVASNYYTGDPDHPVVTQQFSPEQQSLYNQMVTNKGLLGGLGEQGIRSLTGLVGRPLDIGGLPAQGVVPDRAEAVRQRAYDSMMSRVNEDTANQREDVNSNLVAAGFHPGGKGYDDRMNLVNRQYNDARNQAYLGAGQEASRQYGMDASTFGMNNQLRAQSLAEQLAQRQTPLNEINALLSGSQVQNPFATPGYAQNSNVQPAPTFAGMNALAGYNTDLYNQQAAQAGNTNSGLFGLGGAGLMAAGMFSDRRLKSNITRVGTHPLGIGVYDYDLFGTRERGVMADEVAEVLPEAVETHPSGYAMVRYDLIGGRP